jgi:hypothetical protein
LNKNTILEKPIKRVRKFLRIEGNMEIWAIEINGVITQTIKKRIYSFN